MSREIVFHSPIFDLDGTLCQIVVVTPSRAMCRDVKDIMPLLREPHVSPTVPLYAVVTLQRTSVDLIDFSDTTESDKDTSLKTFTQFAEYLDKSCKGTRENWVAVEWPDPPSGTPFRGPPGVGVYCEVSAMESLRVPGFTFEHVCGPAGGCRVLHHPQWGCAVYPATVFVAGPTKENIVDAIASFIAANAKP
eukprot:PhF_6_TR39798/c0_g1_i1/m.59187